MQHDPPTLPDFDDLRALCERDPAAFERLRESLVDACIADAPAHLRQRLRGLQFRIDGERQRAATPMAGLQAIHGMMHAALGQLNDALHGVPPARGPAATVLPMARRDPH